MTSLIDPSVSNIIKSDRVGRIRYAKDYKQQVLLAYQSSTLSGPEFAAQCGIKYPTFASWIGVQKSPAAQATSRPPTFLPAETHALPQAAALLIHLPGGATVGAHNSVEIKLFAELLRHLA